MRLRAFRVRNYCNILDSGRIEVEDHVTCLVGKNEAGKTNLLRALANVEYVGQRGKFQDEDYPRWLLKEHRRSGEKEKIHPITIWMEVEAKEREEWARLTGREWTEGEEVRVYLWYSNEWGWEAKECSGEEIAERLCKKWGVKFTGDTEVGDWINELDKEANEKRKDGSPTSGASRAAKLSEELKKVYGESGEIYKIIGNWIRKNMPKFFYFDEYCEMSGEMDLTGIIQALEYEEEHGTIREHDDLTAAENTALGLLRMAGTEEKIGSDRYEVRSAELEAVANDLTRAALRYWKQNQHLRLKLDIDRRKVQIGSGTDDIESTLLLRVEDQRHMFTNSLDRRSAGFKWFVSFIAAFDAWRDMENTVILLDEPGLGLHGRAQRDLLEFIRDHLAKEHMVVYTTHSPFMITTGALNEVRIVQDEGIDRGTTVERIGGFIRDKDTLFPLQTALGYDVSQDIFIGPDNLVVEGISDYTYLRILSDILERRGRRHLDQRWRIGIAGGNSMVPAYLTLVGQSLDVTVLIDGKPPGAERVRKAIHAGLLEEQRLVTVEEKDDKPAKDIEDLFAVDEYMEMYAHATERNSPAPPGTGRIVKRLENRDGAYNHNKVACWLLGNPEWQKTGIGTGTLTRFEDLITRINGTLGRGNREQK